MGRGFAIAYWEAGRVDIYDRTADRLVVAEVPHPAEPQFVQVGREIRFKPGRHNYSACWTSADHVFALYSGQAVVTSESLEDISHGQVVHVFDWGSGRMSWALHLDTPVIGISVDQDAGWLYAVSTLDAGVYRFRLPGSSLP